MQCCDACAMPVIDASLACMLWSTDCTHVGPAISCGLIPQQESKRVAHSTTLFKGASSIFRGVQSIFEADPAFWQSGAIHSRLGDTRDLSRLPFLRLKVQGIGLDLGLLAKSKATYVNFTAAEFTVDDLRLAYSKIMTEYAVTDDEGSDVADAGEGGGPTTPRPSSFAAAAGGAPPGSVTRQSSGIKPPSAGASLFDR